MFRNLPAAVLLISAFSVTLRATSTQEIPPEAIVQIKELKALASDTERANSVKEKTKILRKLQTEVHGKELKALNYNFPFKIREWQASVGAHMLVDTHTVCVGIYHVFTAFLRSSSMNIQTDFQFICDVMRQVPQLATSNHYMSDQVWKRWDYERTWDLRPQIDDVEHTIEYEKIEPMLEELEFGHRCYDPRYHKPEAQRLILALIEYSFIKWSFTENKSYLDTAYRNVLKSLSKDMDTDLTKAHDKLVNQVVELNLGKNPYLEELVTLSSTLLGLRH